MVDAGATPQVVIRPYEGVGPVDFDMTIEQVEAVLGPPRFRHDDWAPGPVCSYGEPKTRYKVMFDDAKRVEEVVVVDGSAVADGVPLTGRYAEVLDALRAKGHDARVELWHGIRTGVLFFDSLGVHLDSEDPDGDTIKQCGGWRRDAFETTR